MEKDEQYVSNYDLRLELKALRSEVRYWIIAAFVGSSVLNNLPSGGPIITTVLGVLGAAGAGLLKITLFR